MNLDELKIQLNEKAEQDVRSVSSIEMMLKRRSDSVIGKIRTNLRNEIIISVLFIGFCVYIATKYDYRSMQIFAGLFIVLAAAFIFVVVYLLKQIKISEQRPLSVKENIITVIRVIEKYTEYYFKFSIAIIPVSILLPIILVYAETGLSTFTFSPEMLIAFGGVIVLAAMGIYFFNKWYLNKLYGRYTEELKMHLRELQETD